jgi:hypothetical protein
MFLDKNNKILVCIAFHNNIHRIQYIKKVIENYNNYQLDVDIIVDTNETLELNVKTVVHKLEHPYHLTYMHRKHFLDNIDVYDYFMYVEDDMLIPYDAFNEYINNFDVLWDMGSVPSFIRIESYKNKQFATDIINKQMIEPIIVNGKTFGTLSEPYHAFWIMPQKQLKESINSNFTKLNTSRENAASYPMWTLNKRPLIRIENNKISELCYSYHLANNYAPNPDTPFGKIEVKDILKINK